MYKWLTINELRRPQDRGAGLNIISIIGHFRTFCC